MPTPVNDFFEDVTPKHRCKHGAFSCLQCGVGVESVVHTTRAGWGKVARLRKGKKCPSR